MENNETTKKPTQGTWDGMTSSGDRKPRVEFPKLNEGVVVSFTKEYEGPKEYPSKDGDGVFYVFECIQDGEEKVIMSSAWSLLQGLKNLEPLGNKTVKITKDMKDTKQHYTVEEVISEEDEKSEEDNEVGEDEVPVVKPGE